MTSIYESELIRNLHDLGLPQNDEQVLFQNNDFHILTLSAKLGSLMENIKQNYGDKLHRFLFSTGQREPETETNNDQMNYLFCEASPVSKSGLNHAKIAHILGLINPIGGYAFEDQDELHFVGLPSDSLAVVFIQNHPELRLNSQPKSVAYMFITKDAWQQASENRIIRLI